MLNREGICKTLLPTAVVAVGKVEHMWLPTEVRSTAADFVENAGVEALTS
jgi:hypothetical protein